MVAASKIHSTYTKTTDISRLKSRINRKVQLMSKPIKKQRARQREREQDRREAALRKFPHWDITFDDWTPEERAELIKALVKKVTVTDRAGDIAHDIEVRGHLDEYITNAMQFCLREAWE